MTDHRAQLRMCHERIAADVRVHEVRGDEPTQWCSLRGDVWCYDCGMYVCSIHASSRHAAHRSALER